MPLQDAFFFFTRTLLGGRCRRHCARSFLDSISGLGSKMGNILAAIFCCPSTDAAHPFNSPSKQYEKVNFLARDAFFVRFKDIEAERQEKKEQ
jgi:hypothetical protein